MCPEVQTKETRVSGYIVSRQIKNNSLYIDFNCYNCYSYYITVGTNLLLVIDENDSRPMYLQIASQIKEQVSNGILLPGVELPSVRELAESLGINMHTVRGAYLKLREEGIIKLRLGRRAVIARRQFPLHNAGLEARTEARLKEVITDALVTGLSPEDLRRLITGQLARLK
jgi:GntR family transcriptional regulator